MPIEFKNYRPNLVVVQYEENGVLRCVNTVKTTGKLNHKESTSINEIPAQIVFFRNNNPMKNSSTLYSSRGPCF